MSHVFVLDVSGVLSLLFSREADTQGYKPRYGSNTQNGWQALADAGTVPAGQLPGVVGIGWLPSIDVPASENTDNGPYSNDARKRCMKLMKDNGETYADVNAAAVALGACDSFWFFREVMKLAPAPISRANYLLGVHALGGSFQSTGVFATRFDPTHHDGAAAYRHWSYVPRCQCVQYTSDNIARSVAAIAFAAVARDRLGLRDARTVVRRRTSGSTSSLLTIGPRSRCRSQWTGRHAMSRSDPGRVASASSSTALRRRRDGHRRGCSAASRHARAGAKTAARRRSSSPTARCSRPPTPSSRSATSEDSPATTSAASSTT